MVTDIKEEAKKAIVERLGNPILGYIACSWLACNWSNIAFLFMSNEKVEVRIAGILAQPDLWWNNFFIPIIVGVSLYISLPYAQLGLSWLHVKANQMTRETRTKEREKELDAKKKIINKEVEVDRAANLANQKEETKIKEEEEKRKRLSYKTEELKKEYEALRDEKEESERLYNFHTEETKKLKKQQENIQIKLFLIYNRIQDESLNGRLREIFYEIFGASMLMSLETKFFEMYESSERKALNEIAQSIGMTEDEITNIFYKERIGTF